MPSNRSLKSRCNAPSVNTSREATLTKRANSLEDEAQLPVSCALDVLNSPLSVVVVHYNICAETLDVLKVRWTRGSYDGVTRELRELNGVGANGARASPHKDGWELISFKRKLRPGGRNFNLQVSPNACDGRCEGEWDCGGLFKRKIRRYLVQFSSVSLVILDCFRGGPTLNVCAAVAIAYCW